MRDHTTPRAACFAAVFALCACEDSPTEVQRSIRLSLSSSAVVVPQGGTHSLIVTVDRTNFGGPVTLTPGQTTGVGVSLSPAVLGKDATTSIVSVTVSRTAPPTTVPIRIAARGEGIDADSITFDLTINVTGTYTLDVLDKPLVIAQDGGGSTAILVNRVDDYRGVVQFSVGTLPSGIAATWKTDPAEENSGNLSLSANGNVAIGSHEITVTGTAIGLPDKTTTLTINVISPPATAPVTLNFCPAYVPRWAAYKNEGHPWRVVAPNGNSVTFPATARVGFAYVFPWFETNVDYVTREELQQQKFYGFWCEGTKSLVGQVASVTSPQLGRVTAAFAYKDSLQDASPNFTLTRLPNGSVDVIAARGTWNSGFAADKIIVRAVDLPDGGTIPPLDFATQGVAPVPMSISFTGMPPAGQRHGRVRVVSGMSELIVHDISLPTSEPVAMLAAPTSELGTFGLNHLMLWNEQRNGKNTSSFFYFKYFREPSDQTIDVGREIPQVAVSVISRKPYSRMHLSFQSQQEYPAAAAAIFNDGRVWVTVSASYLGATPNVWDIALPDLAGLPGFQKGYMPGASVSSYQAMAMTEPLRVFWNAGQANAGDVWKFSTRYGPLVLGNEAALHASSERRARAGRLFNLPRRR